MTKHFIGSVLLFALAVSVVPARSQGRGGRGQPVSLPDGPGKDLAQTTCTKCHGLNMITNDGYTRAQWITVFNTMVGVPKDQSDKANSQPRDWSHCCSR